MRLRRRRIFAQEAELRAEPCVVRGEADSCDGAIDAPSVHMDDAEVGECEGVQERGAEVRRPGVGKGDGSGHGGHRRRIRVARGSCPSHAGRKPLRLTQPRLGGAKDRRPLRPRTGRGWASLVLDLGLASTEYQYDANNRLLLERDGAGHETHIGYQQTDCGCSEEDEVASIHTPDLAAGQAWCMTWLPNGRLGSVIDPQGVASLDEGSPGKAHGRRGGRKPGWGPGWSLRDSAAPVCCSATRCATAVLPGFPVRVCEERATLCS